MLSANRKHICGKGQIGFSIIRQGTILRPKRIRHRTVPCPLNGDFDLDDYGEAIAVGVAVALLGVFIGTASSNQIQEVALSTP